MRRIGSSLAIILAIVATIAAPAAARGGSDAALNRIVNGPVTSTGAYDLVTPGCDAHSTHRFVFGEGRPPSRSGTIDAEFCVSFATFPWTSTGTFVLTTGTGATLTGIQAGFNWNGPFAVTYTVTAGTRQFKNVSGTIAQEGFDTVLPGNNLSSVGTLVGSLTR